MIENTAKRAPGRVPGRPPGSVWWTITKNGNGPIEMLTIDCGGEEAWPVFGHEEEAGLFLGLGTRGDGWRARESGTGELVSMLYGPYAGVERVVLDPLPQTVAERTVGLVRLDRERFVRLLLTPEGACITSRAGSGIAAVGGTTRAGVEARKEAEMRQYSERPQKGTNEVAAKDARSFEGTRDRDSHILSDLLSAQTLEKAAETRNVGEKTPEAEAASGWRRDEAPRIRQRYVRLR